MFFLLTNAFCLSGKGIAHIMTIPIIEGAAIYTSVNMLQTNKINNKAAAITNLSLLSINTGLGITKLFADESNYSALRKAHRFVGMAVAGASVWIAASTFTDNNSNRLNKGVSAGYSTLTIVPLIMFSF
jgi:hypothetical protein